MKFKLDERDIQFNATKKPAITRVQASAQMQRKTENCCSIFVCLEPVTHHLVRVGYYNGSDRRIPYCKRHADALCNFWSSERKINCYVEIIK